MTDKKVQHEIGARVVTNNGCWGTVVSSYDIQGWFTVIQDDDKRVLQNDERVLVNGARMWDSSYFPEYDDPKGDTA